MPDELKALLEEKVSDGRADWRQVTMRVWRGDAKGGAFEEYQVPTRRGHGRARRHPHASRPPRRPTWPCRWNCKAGKCGSCSAEINGKPRLMCMTRMNTFDAGRDRSPSRRCKTFPLIKDLVTDVSFNYEKAKKVPAFKPGPKEADGTRRMYQEDVDRVQEFHKCIECFLCQDVCHVIRDHPENKPAFAGPRFFVRLAALEMHPLDTNDRLELLKQQGRARLLQHHQVLHRGLPGAHPDHRQRDHPAQGARRHRVPRSGGLGLAQADRRRQAQGRQRRHRRRPLADLLARHPDRPWRHPRQPPCNPERALVILSAAKDLTDNVRTSSTSASRVPSRGEPLARPPSHRWLARRPIAGSPASPFARPPLSRHPERPGWHPERSEEISAPPRASGAHPRRATGALSPAPQG